MSDSESEYDEIEGLMDIGRFVEDEKTKGSSMFVSGWDDDSDGIDLERGGEGNEQKALKAAENGEVEVLRRLFEEDPSLIHAKDEDGYSPLHRASYSGHVNVVEYLISKGADVLAKTEDMWTPLHSACQWNEVLCAIKLLEGGADVNAVTAGGQTPLHVAADHGSSKNCLELLLTHPLVKPDLLNQAGETPLDIARRRGPYHVLFELFEPCLKIVANPPS